MLDGVWFCLADRETLTFDRGAFTRDRPSHRATERSIERPSDRATERPSDRPSDRTTNRTTERPIDRATERSSHRPIEGVTERLSDRPSIARSLDRSVVGSLDTSLDRSVDRSVDLSLDRQAIKNKVKSSHAHTPEGGPLRARTETHGSFVEEPAAGGCVETVACPSPAPEEKQFTSTLQAALKKISTSHQGSRGLGQRLGGDAAAG